MAESPSSAFNGRGLLRLALTLLTLAVLGYSIFHARRMLQEPWQWNGPWLVGSIAVAVILFLGRAWKWRLLIASLDSSISFKQACTSYLGAMPLALVTPGRLGELSRCLFLPQKSVHNLAGAGRVMMDNWTDFLAVLVWSTLGAYLLWGWPGAILGIAASLIFNQLKLWLKVLRYLLNKLTLIHSQKKMVLLRGMGLLKERIEQEFPSLENLSTRDYTASVTLGILLYGLEWLQLAFLLRFLGFTPHNFLILGGLMALATLANSIQVTIAGVGVREGLAVLLLAKAGVDYRVALVAAFIQFALNLMVPALLGLTLKPKSKLRGLFAVSENALP